MCVCVCLRVYVCTYVCALCVRICVDRACMSVSICMSVCLSRACLLQCVLSAFRHGIRLLEVGSDDHDDDLCAYVHACVRASKSASASVHMCMCVCVKISAVGSPMAFDSKRSLIAARRAVELTDRRGRTNYLKQEK